MRVFAANAAYTPISYHNIVRAIMTQWSEKRPALFSDSGRECDLTILHLPCFNPLQGAIPRSVRRTQGRFSSV
jgi:hypothetical protein